MLSRSNRILRIIQSAQFLKQYTRLAQIQLRASYEEYISLLAKSNQPKEQINEQKPQDNKQTSDYQTEGDTAEKLKEQAGDLENSPESKYYKSKEFKEKADKRVNTLDLHDEKHNPNNPNKYQFSQHTESEEKHRGRPKGSKNKEKTESNDSHGINDIKKTENEHKGQDVDVETKSGGHVKINDISQKNKNNMDSFSVFSLFKKFSRNYCTPNKLVQEQEEEQTGKGIKHSQQREQFEGSTKEKSQKGKFNQENKDMEGKNYQEKPNQDSSPNITNTIDPHKRSFSSQQKPTNDEKLKDTLEEAKRNVSNEWENLKHQAEYQSHESKIKPEIIKETSKHQYENLKESLKQKKNE